MTALLQEGRDPGDAFWDVDGPGRRVGARLGIAIAVCAALGGVALWTFTKKWRLPAKHIVPSAADIRVRYPPPR